MFATFHDIRTGELFLLNLDRITCVTVHDSVVRLWEAGVENNSWEVRESWQVVLAIITHAQGM